VSRGDVVEGVEKTERHYILAGKTEIFPAFKVLWQYPAVLLVTVRCREGKALRSRGQKLIRIFTKFFSVSVLGNMLLTLASSRSCFRAPRRS
jgi:hypothetical protein